MYNLQKTNASSTVLQIQGESSKVCIEDGNHQWTVVDLLLGIDSLAATIFRHSPPKPFEIEEAIEFTENIVMPLVKQFTGGDLLQLQGLGATLMAVVLNYSHEHQSQAHNIDEIECIFNRLAAISEGRPVGQDSLPTDSRFFATVVIVREFMHHLNFRNIQINI